MAPRHRFAWGAAALVWLGVPVAASADWQDYCPWVGSSYLATSCGNGVCDGVSPDIETPVNCPRDCSSDLVMAYYSEDTHCDGVTQVYYPSSEADVVAEINAARTAGKHVNFGGSGHSGNQIICNDGVVIRSWNMKNIYGLETFNGEEVVRFDGGVEFWDLVHWLEANGRAVDMPVTGYGHISLGGALGTGVHGTHGWGFSSVSHYVRSIRLVKADGTVQEYTNDGTDTWRALTANLGALGYVSQIRMAVRPRFNIHMRVDTFPESALLATNGLLNLSSYNGTDCKYFVLLWYPGPYTKTLIRLCGWETTEPAQPNAANTIIAPDIDPNLQQDFRSNMQLGACYDTTNWSEEQKRRDFFVNNSPLVTDYTASPRNHVQEVVGPWHHMIDWRFEPGQIQFSQTDWEVAIPLSEFDAMVNAVNTYVKAHDLAFSVVGTFIRLDQADDASLLGGNSLGTYFSQGQRIVHFEVPVFTPWDMPPDQRDAYEQRWRDMFKMILDNFHVRPHWGKNQNWVFSYPSVMAENASRRARFQTVLNQFDPTGLFARVHLARAGFTWPSGGNFDVDGDGMNEQTEIQYGSNPDHFNGFRTRIAPADPAGDCAYQNTWAELESNYASPTNDFWARAGWAFDTSNHNYTRNTYTWNPWPAGNGYITWGARFSGNFDFRQTGTYCFSVDNAATGSDIIGGRNACLNVWYDQSRLAQTGYSTAGDGGSSPRTGCVNVSQVGVHRIDLSSRNHDANGWRNFVMRARYCYGGASTCTPDQAIPQYLVEPL